MGYGCKIQKDVVHPTEVYLRPCSTYKTDVSSVLSFPLWPLSDLRQQQVAAGRGWDLVLHSDILLLLGIPKGPF